MTNKPKEDVNGAGYEWEYAKKIDNRTTTQKILNFIYDPQTHAFMGRTAKSWGGILLFYAIFYSILAVLFAICMKVLLSTLNDSYPKFQLDESLLGSNPGLGFRPQTEDPETASVIWFNTTDQKNIESWIHLVDKFFDAEYKKNSPKAVNCTYGHKLKSDEFCRVPIDNFGPCSKTYGYGYAIGKPCVFIKLNRIYRWEPQTFKDMLDCPPEMPIDVSKKIDTLSVEERKTVWVSCDGQSAHDKENIGPLSYYPSIQGFPSYYYPYLHVADYQSPLVAVQFEAVRRNVIINIECKAWAKNIRHTARSQVREGSVHFELQVDDRIGSTNGKNVTNTRNNQGVNDNANHNTISKKQEFQSELEVPRKYSR